MKILVCAEINADKFDDQTAKTIAAALNIGDDITLLVVGKNAHHIAQSQSFEAVQKHLYYETAFKNDSNVTGNAELTADILISIAADYDVIMAPATTCWKNVLPRASALLDMMMMSDVMDIIDHETYKRPIYAGNALVTLRNKEPKKIMTIRTTCFDPVANNDVPNIEEINPIAIPDYASQFISKDISKGDRPELTSAKIIVSGGRGVGSQENFKIIEQFADLLGAAVGASRAAVDAGFVPNDYQVGQTGKIVAPEIYIAIGISGAIQHLAGMKDSKVIIAINKDPDAPIFKVADYGLVMDLFEAMPLIEQELKNI